MIEVFTPDQRLTGDAARQALRTESRFAARKAAIAARGVAAKAEADALLATARQEAAALLAQAGMDAAAVRAAAEGQLGALRAQARQDFGQQLTAELGVISTHLADVVLAALDKVVGDIGAGAMARAAVLHVMRAHPQIAAARLRVAPDSVPDLADLPLEVVADASLGAGEAVLETAQGLVDLGAAAQLAALRMAIGQQPTRGAA